MQLRQGLLNLLCLILGILEFNGVAVLNRRSVNLESNLRKPGAVYVYLHTEIIAVPVTGRIVACLLAIGQFAFDLVFALVNGDSASRDLVKSQYIGVVVHPVPNRICHTGTEARLQV